MVIQPNKEVICICSPENPGLTITEISPDPAPQYRPLAALLRFFSIPHIPLCILLLDCLFWILEQATMKRITPH